MERQPTIIHTFDATARGAVTARQDEIAAQAEPFDALHDELVVKQAQLDEQCPDLVEAWVDGGTHEPIQALRDEIDALTAKQGDVDEALALIDRRVAAVTEVLRALEPLKTAEASAVNSRTRIAQFAAQGMDHLRPDVRESINATAARLPQIAADVLALMRKHRVEVEGAERLLEPVQKYADRLADVDALLGIGEVIHPELAEETAA